MFPTGGSEQFKVLKPRDIEYDIVHLKGKSFHEIYRFVRSVIVNQFQREIKRGIRGFLFHGEVGTGKTVMAKALARDLNLVLYYIDGADIARALYGQSEQQISTLFREASKTARKGLILIDDAESVFPSRDWTKGQSWHVAQDNVFFHELDNVDSSKCIVIVTTNRYDLMDKAVIDRLYPIEFPSFDTDDLIEIAKLKCVEYGIDSANVIKEIKNKPDKYRSVRTLEKLIVQEYVKQIQEGSPAGEP